MVNIKLCKWSIFSSLFFLMTVWISDIYAAEIKTQSAQKAAERRNYIIKCCGRKSCVPTKKMSTEPTTTIITTTTQGTTIPTEPPTTTEPITTEFTTEVIVPLATDASKPPVTPVTVFSPSTRSSTTRATTTATIAVTMKPTDPRKVTPKYVTVPTEFTTIATTPYASYCQYCILDQCKTEVTELANAIALGKNGNLPGAFNPITVGVKKYHFAKGHYLRMINAMIFCRQHGYDLVQIESKEEHELLQAQLVKLDMKNNWVFAGGHKIGNCSHRWLNGKPFTVNFWYPGNPVEGLTEQCIIFWLGAIWDVMCMFDKEFICEAPD